LVRVFLNGSAIIQDNTKAPSGGAILRTYVVPLLDGPKRCARSPLRRRQRAEQRRHRGGHRQPAAGPQWTLFAIVSASRTFPRALRTTHHPVVDAQLIADTLRSYSAPCSRTRHQTADDACRDDKEHVVRALEAMRRGRSGR